MSNFDFVSAFDIAPKDSQKNRVNDEVQRLESFFEKSLKDDWRQSFINRHGGVEEAPERRYIDRLVGRDGAQLMRELPGNDHVMLWLKDGQPVIYTMEPYHMFMEDYEALGKFCHKYGLTYRTESRGWYNPGVSTLIVISRNKKHDRKQGVD
ncbi:MAG: hypothetical protein VR64_07220 [Desulfatitalea sp. BRH_c12]|nr:MAG: hypothetical protein VR64_07220 [Desulfatitalea sp. BRH_c12]